MKFDDEVIKLTEFHINGTEQVEEIGAVMLMDYSPTEAKFHKRAEYQGPVDRRQFHCGGGNKWVDY